MIVRSQRRRRPPKRLGTHRQFFGHESGGLHRLRLRKECGLGEKIDLRLLTPMKCRRGETASHVKTRGGHCGAQWFGSCSRPAAEASI